MKEACRTSGEWIRNIPTSCCPWAAAVLMLAILGRPVAAVAPEAVATYRKEIQPILAKYCFDCHADGAKKGNVSFDGFKSDDELVGKHELWHAVLKNTRAEIMPPARKPRPTAAEQQVLERWIKYGAFALDAKNPDPGRVTLRRLNRVEYRNTVRDLLGVDFDTDKEFPPDDSGHGFDNIGDVLTLPPMLLEKYLAAAKTIVGKAVPSVPRVPAENMIAGRKFQGEVGTISRTNRNPNA